MRRPVKPFVTEYKGTARRPPSPSMNPEEDKAPHRPIEASRFVSPPPGEDSYEAALRAADALFSGQARVEPSPSSPRNDPDRAPAPSTGGRILRVIDEAPPQELIDLETERAPKRRGRKPGSKNKPKTPQTLPTDMATPRSKPSPTFAALTAQALTAMPTKVSVATTETVVRTAAVATGVRRGERYAWVRTQLKPGQSWKRHLPKVIW